MKIEEGRYYHKLNKSVDGAWSDTARNLSYVNAKSVTQTIRKKGKYIPQTFLIRFTCTEGSADVYSLPNSWPIRNSIVLMGAARDAMLKSAGVRRSNLEAYQKELRLLPSTEQVDGNGLVEQSDYTLPNNAGGLGFDAPADFGRNVTYDYSEITYEEPAGGADTSNQLTILGNSQGGDDGSTGVVAEYLKWRRNYTAPTDANDIDPDNLISAIMQQGQTAKEIITQIADEADEKPYNLEDFKAAVQHSIVSKDAGRNSVTLEVPVGLYWFAETAGTGQSESATIEIEVLGHRDM